MKPALDAFALQLIRRKARQLAGKHSFADWDREDIEQELTLQVLQGLNASAQTPDEPKAFITTIVNRCAINLIKHQNRQKRSQPKCQSLDSKIRTADGWIELGQTVEEDRRLAHRGCELPDEHRRQEQAMDVATVLQQLPDDLRRCAEAIMNGQTLNQVADDARIPRSTLRDRLRKHFEAAGFSGIF